MTKSWDPLPDGLVRVYQGEGLIGSGAQQPGVSSAPDRPEVSPIPYQPGAISVSPQPGVTTVSSQPGVTTVSSQPGVTTTSSQPVVTTMSPQPGVTTAPPRPGVPSAQDVQTEPAPLEHSKAVSAPPRSASTQALSQNEAAQDSHPSSAMRPGITKNPDSRVVSTSPAEDPLQDRTAKLHEAADLIDSALQHPLSARTVLALGITQALAPAVLPSPPASLRERATADSTAGRNIVDRFMNLMTAGQQNLPAHWTVWPTPNVSHVVQALTYHAADPAGDTPGGAPSLSAWADGMQAAQNLDRRGHDQLLEAQRLLATAGTGSESTINALLVLADALPKAQQGCDDRTSAVQMLSAHTDETVSAFDNHTQHTESLFHAFTRAT
ncbi:hypothetical protein [Nocardia alni]|uniref:hypothetical protein n=1 Tax=Nocardia alni TaxID=2815723 RepID=UPI001C23AADB|nr:hypothetical protein [Nocardia alni]